MGRWSLVTRDDPDYTWFLSTAYYNYKPLPLDPYKRVHAENKPHGIGFVIDTTPFDDKRIRASELKSIATLAFFRNAAPAYRHLDYFGVSAQSCPYPWPPLVLVSCLT